MKNFEHVDWSRSNAEIAAELGLAASAVSSVRSMLCIPIKGGKVSRFMLSLGRDACAELTAPEIAQRCGASVSAVHVAARRLRFCVKKRQKAWRKVEADLWSSVDWSMTDREIAAQIGLSKQRVNQVRHRIGTQCPRKVRHAKLQSLCSDPAYVVSHTVGEIAATSHVCCDTVRKLLRKLGMKAKGHDGSLGSLYRHEHTVWRNMIQRCHNPNCPHWSRYGGRGIVVCDQWRGSFEAFLVDMGPRPAHPNDGKRAYVYIERDDNDGPYCPENCRWATAKENQRNRRSNVCITYRGETRCAAEWSEITGIKQGTITHRLQAGWSIERIFNTPVRPSYNRRLKGLQSSQRSHP